MLIAFLCIAIVLVAWSLHLMQEAIDQQEFSLMLAGTLVAAAAAAMVGVYFLTGNYLGYVTRISHEDAAWNQAAYESLVQYLRDCDLENSTQIYLSDSSGSSPSIQGLQPIGQPRPRG